MKLIKLFIFLLVVTNSYSQVTLRITSIPSNTPTNSIIYVAGSFNTWNSGSSQYIMQPDGLGAWTITIPEGTGIAEYKITRGNWTSVEGNATGGYLPNRTFTFTGFPQVKNITVQSWEDISGSSGNSTAAANVQVLSSSFFIPQLNRYRKIWIYLPPDYFTTTKNYPVLYMQDGQNLFDNQTSFSGEWHVDETLNTLHSEGDYGAIVIGIENGGALRINEYSPWINPNYGGGGGDLYMQFVAETLKPFVDANFRTLIQPQYNALIGSSLGALISVYGAVKYPQYFGKVGVFSPAFWFVRTPLNNYINATTNTVSSLRMYFVAGQNEDVDMVPDLNTVRNNLIAKGVLTANTFTKIDSFGTHTEGYWSGEFSAAYQWLFQQENLHTSSYFSNRALIFLSNKDSIWASGIEENTPFVLINYNGQIVDSLILKNGSNKLPQNYTTGLYFLKSKNYSTVKLIFE